MFTMYIFSVIQGILNNKQKLLVTHSLQFLSAADNIIILKQVIEHNVIRVVNFFIYNDSTTGI